MLFETLLKRVIEIEKTIAANKNETLVHLVKWKKVQLQNPPRFLEYFEPCRRDSFRRHFENGEGPEDEFGHIYLQT